MVIIKLMGGLGNQLQQYALYRKFISMGVPAKLDLEWFNDSTQKNMLAKRSVEIDNFPSVSYEVCTASEKKALLGNKLTRRLAPSKIRYHHEVTPFDEKLLKYTDMYLEGYYACEYYYADILDTLRLDLKFPLDRRRDDDSFNAICDKLSSDSSSVSLHIRRGDYLDDANRNMFGGICTDEYYDAAIRYVIEHMASVTSNRGDGRAEDSCRASSAGTPNLYIFSDDNEYAVSFASKIQGKYHINAETVNVNSGDNNYFDIYLMSLCRANICANSTFSFWGARLNSSMETGSTQPPDLAKAIGSAQESASAQVQDSTQVSGSCPLKIRPTKQINSQPFDPSLMHNLWKGWTFISPEGEVC